MSYGDRFQEAVEDLIEQEGGFTNHPNDKGGATKYGITLNFYQRYVDSEATVDDIKNLSKKKTKKIYYNHFWNPEEYAVNEISYGDLPKPIGEMIFLYAVNAGWNRGNKLLQQGLNRVGFDVETDGWLGPNTVEAANNANRGDLLKWISIKAAKFYTEIVLNNSDQKVFLEGWLNRAFTTLLDSLKYMVDRDLRDLLE